MGRVKGIKNKIFHPNTFIVDGEITTTDINGVYVVFSTHHLNRVEKVKWFYDKKSGYCFCNSTVEGKRKPLRLHKFLTGWFESFVDHIDRNKLNNTDENLRKCTHQQNMINKELPKHKFRGVYKIKNCSTFRCRIKIHQKTIHLGHFKTALEAAIAYNQAALTYFGEFARLNELPKLDSSLEISNIEML
jgi:hypothetical protein